MHKSPQLSAFLDMIAWSEHGDDVLKMSDNGYNVIVGSTRYGVDLFNSYKDHPRKKIYLPRLKIFSTGAGRYQILMRTFDFYKVELKLPDFSKESQDAIAVRMLRECRALDDIEAGRLERAIDRCKSRWASLPNAGYKQHEHKIGKPGGEMDLADAFVRAGGVLAA